MLPAQQRLDADEMFVREVHERLVDDLELAALQRHAHVGLEPNPLDRLLVHTRHEDLVAAARLALGLVHGDVGIAEHGHRVVVARFTAHDADARGHEEGAILDLDRLDDGRADALRGGDGIVDAARILDEDGELVASESGGRVLDAQDGPKPSGDLDEHVVTGVVSQCVVDGLEGVEVQVEDGWPEAPTARPMERLLEPVAEEDPVGQPGEGVMESP